jgi:hypothetical protein
VKTVVETQHRVMPWWRMAGNGPFVFFVRASQKPIEFEKSKAGIAIASLDKLPALIDTLITAVRNKGLSRLPSERVIINPSKTPIAPLPPPRIDHLERL